MSTTTRLASLLATLWGGINRRPVPMQDNTNLPAIASHATPSVESPKDCPMAAVILTKRGLDGRSYAVALTAKGTTARNVVDVKHFTGTDTCAALAVDAFAHVQQIGVDSDTPIDLYIGNRWVREWFERQDNRYLRPRYFNGHGVADVRVHAERIFAERLASVGLEARPGRVFDNRSAATVTIATDASARTGHRGVGIAYVTDAGEWQQDYLPTTSSVAVGELEAILLALSATRAHRMVILSDCRGAVAWIQGKAEPPSSQAARRVSRIRRDIAGRDITIRWVKAHAGHPLNETADRLAVAARRNAVANVAADTRAQIAKRIVADLTTASSVA